MKCHNDQSNQEAHQHKGHKGHKGHMVMMLVCCGAPLLVFLLIPSLAGRFSLGTWAQRPFLISLICPIMMVVMMGLMMRGQKKPAPDHSEDDLGPEAEL